MGENENGFIFLLLGLSRLRIYRAGLGGWGDWTKPCDSRPDPRSELFRNHAPQEKAQSDQRLLSNSCSTILSEIVGSRSIDVWFSWRPRLPTLVNPQPLVRIKPDHALNRRGKPRGVHLNILLLISGSN